MGLVLVGQDVLGESDCEAVGAGLLAQPVGAVTSLAYLVAGVVLAWLWRSLPGKQRWSATLYAVLLALVGTGSVLYHGPQGSAASVLHDVPIVALLAVGVGVPVLRLARGSRALRQPSPRRSASLGLLVAVALAAYVAGRTGSVLCDPASPWQMHGMWHLASAAVLTLWGRLLWPAPS